MAAYYEGIHGHGSFRTILKVPPIDAPAIMAMTLTNRLLALNTSLETVKRARQTKLGSVSNVQDIPVAVKAAGQKIQNEIRNWHDREP